jgi:hypothetical protein
MASPATLQISHHPSRTPRGHIPSLHQPADQLAAASCLPKALNLPNKAASPKKQSKNRATNENPSQTQLAQAMDAATSTPRAVVCGRLLRFLVSVRPARAAPRGRVRASARARLHYSPVCSPARTPPSFIAAARSLPLQAPVRRTTDGSASGSACRRRAVQKRRRKLISLRQRSERTECGPAWSTALPAGPVRPSAGTPGRGPARKPCSGANRARAPYGCLKSDDGSRGTANAACTLSLRLGWFWWRASPADGRAVPGHGDRGGFDFTLKPRCFQGAIPR